MSPDAIAALGAFLSGVASVISATWFVRRDRERAERECEKRLDAFREGIEIGERHSRG